MASAKHLNYIDRLKGYGYSANYLNIVSINFNS